MNARRELREFIAHLFAHGLNDREVSARLTDSDALVQLGRMTKYEDLVGVIRDLMGEVGGQ